MSCAMARLERAEHGTVPGDISQLIDIYALGHPEYNPYFCTRLLKRGLIATIEGATDHRVYEATERGRAFVQMLCDTPLPQQRWVDPRTQVVVREE